MNDSGKNDPRLADEYDKTAGSTTAALVAVLDDYLAGLKAGSAPGREELIARHPHLATQLEGCLAGLDFIHASEQASPTKPQTLGDFRILSEIGRGGMGAVYKAQQLTLRRVVALKVLRFGAIPDAEALERFRRETETVAALHHTNIVPIFAVGSENGVNYYAMQFIEGCSLAEAAAEAGGPMPAESVAQWGLQAAEALAHAHQRGVIHRDIKPSNLLLDNENRVWLTDFGLARRMDDATLSLAGVLLGTPRYMSPEQAAASGERLDHRTDIFSLGATLYELIAGQPAFAGETPHAVIEHILQSEPTPLRKLVPQTPRDLDTIISKCMAKEPSQRYDTARSLAEDLRAMLDGRPIAARRAGPVVAARQWLQKRRSSVVASTRAVAATITAALCCVAGWLAYTAWNAATVRFDAARAPLAATILDARGRVVHAETAPMQTAANLPAGDYQVRVSGGPVLSQTFDMTLQRGEAASHVLSLDDQLLWEPQQIDRGFSLVDLKPVSFSGGVDRPAAVTPSHTSTTGHSLAVWTDRGLRVRHGGDPAADWTVALEDWRTAIDQAAPELRWPWDGMQSPTGGDPLQPGIAERTIDADGDGVGDLICSGRNQAWLAAVSGQTGGLLWIAARGTDLLEAPGAGPALPLWLIRSTVVGDPVVGYDCDGDGVGDIIATLLDADPQQPIRQNQVSVRRWVEAISGKTGGTLWTYELPQQWFVLPAGEEVPYAMRWFSGAAGGRSTIGSTAANVLAGQLSRDRVHVVQTGVHAYRPDAARLVTLHGSPRVAVVGGQHAVVLDPVSGAVIGPAVDIGHRVAMPPQWVDVDADGSDDLVLLATTRSSGAPAKDLARVVVWSASLESALWSAELDVELPSRPNWIVGPPQWPLVADLDADGRPEVVVPGGQSSRFVFDAPGRKPWGAIAVLHGETGRPLWQRQIVSMDRRVDHFVAGPDLDGDGRAEIFAVTLAGRDPRVYVDALSGAGGQTLWTAYHPLRAAGEGKSPTDVWFMTTRTSLAPPRWWRAGNDGWPQLLVHVVEEGTGAHASQLLAFSAGTGMLSHTSYGATQAAAADVDGDGVDELLAYVATIPEAPGRGGRLHCIRGVASEPWRRLGSAGTPIADFDQDGVVDLVRSSDDGVLIAVSGRGGRELWRSVASRTGATVHFTAAAAGRRQGPGSLTRRPLGDLDRDGVDDLLVWHDATFGGIMPPFCAVSGRTGRVLWTATDIEASIIGGVVTAEARDLDGDDELEVIWVAALNYGYPDMSRFSTADVQLRVFVCSGRTGRLQWTQPLSPAYGQTPASVAPFHLHAVGLAVVAADLDKDEYQDLILPLINERNDFAYAALSGKDGRFIWRRRRGPDISPSVTLNNWISPALCDLDGDGNTEVIIVEPAAPGQDGQLRSRVLALTGSDGRSIWSHRSESLYAPRQSLTDRIEPLQPVAMRTDDAKQRVGVFLPGASGRVAIFADSGLMAERALVHSTEASGLWVLDSDGDEFDEIAVLDGPNIYLAKPDRLDDPLWQRTFGMTGQQQILSVVPAIADRPQLLALATGPTDNGVLGLDVRDGRTVWACPGPVLRDATSCVYNSLQAINLLGGRNDEMPYVFYSLGPAEICRQAVLVQGAPGQPEGHSSHPVLAEHPRWGIHMASARITSGRVDERWLRDLPWRLRRDAWGDVARLVGWSIGLSLALLLIPAAWLYRALAWRRLSLRQLLALPVIAALCLLATLAVAPPPLQSLQSKLLAAAASTPLVIFSAVMRWYLARRHWRSIVAWLAVSVVLATLFGAVILAVEDLTPGEHYDWSGWPVIWLPALYVTAWLATAWWVLRWLGGTVIRGARSLRRPLPVHGHDAPPLPSTTLVAPAQPRQLEEVHAGR